MKTHSEFSVPLPPSGLIVGHVDCVQAGGGGGVGGGGVERGVNEVLKEPFSTSHTRTHTEQFETAESSRGQQ